MAALTAERDTPCQHHDFPFNYAQKGNTKIFNGSLCMTDANGYLVPGADTANCKVAGRAQATGDTTVTNTITPGVALADGVGNLDALNGVFQYDNPVGANQLTLADEGKLAYVLTDHELCRAAGTVNSIIAGRVLAVDLVNNKVTIDTRVRAV